MEVTKVAHCRVRKGLGPEYMEKDITVSLDDIEPGTPKHYIDEMLYMEAKTTLILSGHIDFFIDEIEGY